MIALLALCSRAPAQNLRDVPLGGKTATMGGAGVAAGSDDAMPYLNPAGVAAVPYDLFLFSASAYAYSRASVPRYFRAGGVDPTLGSGLSVDDERLEIEQVAIIPSSAGYVTRLSAPGDLWQHVASVSLITPTYNDYAITGSFRARTSAGRLEEDFIARESFRQVLAGPTYALSVGDRVRLGASVFASYATFEIDTHDLALFSLDVDGVQVPSSLNSRALIDAYSVGLGATVGAQLRVAGDLWLGAAYELMGVPLVGGGDYLETTDVTTFDAAGNPSATRVNSRGELSRFDLSRPSRISAGAAWSTPHGWSLAADMHFQPARRQFLYGEVDATFSQMTAGQPIVEQRGVAIVEGDTQDTWNVSAGVEYYVRRNVALRAGVLTDRDVGARSRSGGPDSRLDWTVFTLGFAVRDGVRETTYGVGYRYGSGERPTRETFSGEGTATQVDYTAHGVILILSGAIRTTRD